MNISRREFIRMGIGLAAASTFLRDPFALFAAAKKKDWAMPHECRIGFASGKVFVNDAPADVGDPARAGDVISTGNVSEADIEVRDYSIFHLKENSSVKVNDILANPSIEVKKGWFLVIVRKGTPLTVRTSTVLAGVRGTVFFINVFSDEQAYLCDCNGKIELIDPGTGELIQKVSSTYHTAFTISREREAVDIKKSRLLYHTDGDILRMGERFLREVRIFKTRQASGAPTRY